MRKCRFLHLTLLLLFVLASCTACHQSKPVKAAKAELELIRSLDEETITAFVSYEDMMNSEGSVSDIGPEAARAVKLFFEHFDYKILSSSATENTATVNVEIENIDAKALAKDLCLKMLTLSLTPDEAGEKPLTTNSYFALLEKLLKENTYELVDTKAHIELVNLENGWTVQSTEQLQDELVGGFISYLRDPYLVTPEEIAELTFRSLDEFTADDWLSYLDMTDIFITGSIHYAEADRALAERIAEHFSYKIRQVEQTDTTATAVIELTSLDMGEVLKTYSEKLLAYADTTASIRASDAELADKTALLLVESLTETSGTLTQQINITFKNNGRTWDMKFENDFPNALFGGLNEAMEAFQKTAES